MKKTLLIMLAAAAVAACKKDDLVKPQIQSDTIKLTKIMVAPPQDPATVIYK